MSRVPPIRFDHGNPTPPFNNSKAGNGGKWIWIWLLFGGAVLFLMCILSAGIVFAFWKVNEADEKGQRRGVAEKRSRATVAEQPINSFDSALRALRSTQQPEWQLAGIKWFQNHPLDQLVISDQAKDSLFRLMADIVRRKSNQEVYRGAFEYLLKNGDSSHSVAIIEGARVHQVSEQDATKWFKKYNDSVAAKQLINFAVQYEFGRNVLSACGESFEDFLVARMNSEFRLRDKFLQILEEKDAPPEKLARQCIEDIGNKSSSVNRNAYQWLAENEPVDSLRKEFTEKIIECYHNLDKADSRTRSQFSEQAAIAISKWATEESCETVEEMARVYTSPACSNAFTEFFIQFNNEHAIRGLVFLLSRRSSQESAFLALKKMGPTKTTTFLLPWINASFLKDKTRQLLKEFKTDPSLIAEQCLVDLEKGRSGGNSSEINAVRLLRELNPDPKPEWVERFLKIVPPINNRRTGGSDSEMLVIYCRWLPVERKQDLEKLMDNGSDHVRREAFKRQYQLEPAVAITKIKKMLPEKRTNRGAINRLNFMQEDSEAIILPIISESGLSVKRQLITILSRFGTEKSLPKLNDISEKNPELKRNVSAAVRAIQSRAESSK